MNGNMSDYRSVAMTLKSTEPTFTLKYSWFTIWLLQLEINTHHFEWCFDFWFHFSAMNKIKFFSLFFAETHSPEWAVTNWKWNCMEYFVDCFCPSDMVNRVKTQSEWEMGQKSTLMTWHTNQSNNNASGQWKKSTPSLIYVTDAFGHSRQQSK